MNLSAIIIQECSNVLNENKLHDFLKKCKYRLDMTDQSRIEEFYRQDPTPTKKYFNWLAVRVVHSDADIVAADLAGYSVVGDLISLVGEYHNFTKYGKIQPDIYKYKTVKALRDDLHLASQKVSKTQLRNASKSGIKKIYKDSDIQIVHVLDQNASCIFGKGTKWCISAERSQNAWSQYQPNNEIFFVFQPDEDPHLKKVAILFDKHTLTPRSMFDAHDQSISMEFMKSNSISGSRYEKLYDAIKIIQRYLEPKKAEKASEQWSKYVDVIYPALKYNILSMFNDRVAQLVNYEIIASSSILSDDDKLDKFISGIVTYSYPKLLQKLIQKLIYNEYVDMKKFFYYFDKYNKTSLEKRILFIQEVFDFNILFSPNSEIRPQDIPSIIEFLNGLFYANDEEYKKKFILDTMEQLKDLNNG